MKSYWNTLTTVQYTNREKTVAQLVTMWITVDMVSKEHLRRTKHSSPFARTSFKYAWKILCDKEVYDMDIRICSNSRNKIGNSMHIIMFITWSLEKPYAVKYMKTHTPFNYVFANAGVSFYIYWNDLFEGIAA